MSKDNLRLITEKLPDDPNEERLDRLIQYLYDVATDSDDVYEYTRHDIMLNLTQMRTLYIAWRDGKL